MSSFLILLIIGLILPILLFENLSFNYATVGIIVFCVINIFLLASKVRWFSCAILLGLVLGTLSFYANKIEPYSNKFVNCSMLGKIVSIGNNYLQYQASNIKCNSLTADFANKEINLDNQIIQYWTRNNERLQLGASYRVTGDLFPVTSRQNLYEFDYEHYLLRHKVRLSSNKLEFAELKTTNNLNLLSLKSKVQSRIIANLSVDNANLIRALVTGERSKLTTKQRDIITKTNTQHLLAISGLHLAIIGFWSWFITQAIFSLLRPLHRFIMPIQAGGICALVVMFGYAYFTGMQVPAQRAFIMFAFIISSWILLKPISNNSLFFALIALLLINPYVIYDGGFYLSFMATFVVIKVSSYKLSALVKTIFMQLAIIFTLMPISGYLFGYISFTGILSNLLVIPWLTVWVLPIAVLSCVVDIIAPNLASWLWLVCDFNTSVLWAVLSFFAEFDWRYELLERWSLSIIIMATAGMLISLHKKNPYYLVATLLLILPEYWFVNNNPQILVAESKPANILVHNGFDAILFNSGRKQQNKYRRYNQSEKWLRYLYLHRLNLTAIYLADNTLSSSVAIKELLKHFPKLKIISLTENEYHYPTEFCKSTKFDNIVVTAMQEIGKYSKCNVKLDWFGHEFAVNINTLPNEDGLVDYKNQLSQQLVLDGQYYDTKQYGMLILSLDDDKANKIYVKSVRNSRFNLPQPIKKEQ